MRKKTSTGTAPVENIEALLQREDVANKTDKELKVFLLELGIDRVTVQRILKLRKQKRDSDVERK